MPTDKNWFFNFHRLNMFTGRSLGVIHYGSDDYGRAIYDCVGFCFWFFEIEFYWKVEA